MGRTNFFEKHGPHLKILVQVYFVYFWHKVKGTQYPAPEHLRNGCSLIKLSKHMRNVRENEGGCGRQQGRG